MRPVLYPPPVPMVGPPPPPVRPPVPPPAPPPPADPGPDFELGVHRMHWMTAPLRAMVIVLVFLAVPGVALLEFERSVLGLVILPVGVLALAFAFASWWEVRFKIVGDDLIYESGPFVRRSRQIPLSRLQAVDVVRPLVIRFLGLAEVRLELAGGDRAEIVFRYLGQRDADRLRATLLARAAGLSGSSPEAPERTFFRVPAGMLLGGLLLRVPVLASVFGFAALLAVGIVMAEPGVLGAAVPLLLGLLRGFVGPMFTQGGFVVAVSPDGLRVRRGLLETRMQTVPPRRVQAVRVTEPLLWRGLGLVRLEVNVAGYVGDRQMATAMMLPAAPRPVAFGLLNVLFPGGAEVAERLLDTPVRMGQSTAGLDAAVFVSRHGRFCRYVEIASHGRAQSVRLTSGPLQRRRGTATVHVDVPPGPVDVSAPGRPSGDARGMVDAVAEHMRRSRTAEAPPERWAAQATVGEDAATPQQA
ncbi:MAG: PH domain-containing protein [Streptosporangiales bacterium]|nr:PH domain-containing protein [Streptosporangiales bacterium]